MKRSPEARKRLEDLAASPRPMRPVGVTTYDEAYTKRPPDWGWIVAWFKVDDKLHSHPKRYRAGLRAMGLWVVAGSWCGDHLTDGFVPADMLRALGGKPSDAAALVDAGLWEACPDGWIFHQWDGQNPTRDDVEFQRAEWRRRQQEARDRRHNEGKDAS